jgi:hypothetical protein
MKIEWTDDECGAAEDARGVAISVSASDPCADRWRVAIEAVMTRAVERYLARASGQVKEDEKELRDTITYAWSDDDDVHAADHAALSRLSALANEAGALRAKVAELEQETKDLLTASREVLALRAEVDALKSRCAVLRDRAQTAEREMLLARQQVEHLKGIVIPGAGWKERALSAGSRLAAIRERANARDVCERFRDEGITEGLRWVLEGDAPNSPGIPEGSPNVSTVSNGSGEAPHDIYQCHVENCPECGRVIASEIEAKGPAAVAVGFASAAGLPVRMVHRWPCSPTCTHDDAANPGHPERVKERSEAVIKASGPLGEDTSEEARAYDAGLTTGYDNGAEDMRAACLSAVCEMYNRQGGCVSVQDLKAAIEGAAP